MSTERLGYFLATFSFWQASRVSVCQDYSVNFLSNYVMFGSVSIVFFNFVPQKPIELEI